MTVHDLQRNSRELPEYRVTGQSIKLRGVRRAGCKSLWGMTGQFTTDIMAAYTLQVITVTSLLLCISLK